MTEENPDMKNINRIQVVDDDKNTKLHYSAASGNEEEMFRDLENQKKIDVENYLGWTPMMMACRKGHINIIKILLERRADATRKNRFGISVFLMCVASGKMELLELILNHLLSGGVSRQSMQSIFSPLSMAILFNHDEIVRNLISKSFNVDALTPLTGITPLMFAAAMDNSKIFSLLISKRANSALRNWSGQTAQDITASKHSKPKTSNEHPNKPYMMQPPMILVSPSPSFIPLPSGPVIRKSSNIHTPNYYFPTNVTPITPITMVPQMFFPPEFSPSQFVSPVATVFSPNDFLNMRVNNSPYLSPAMTHLNYPSPCV